jgi:predicted site-specific integrase-resolvase
MAFHTSWGRPNIRVTTCKVASPGGGKGGRGRLCPNWPIVCLRLSAPKRKQRLASRRTGRVQLGQRAALYCRVSTADQSCARQERDLTAFADRAGYEVVGVFKETGSGVRLDRAERRKVLALAQARQIDAVLVTELSRWGRSTTDLLATLTELGARRV